MTGLSLLIFSRNTTNQVLALAKDMRSVANDIVVVDSSDKTEAKKLVRAASTGRHGRLRIFHTVALGYPEPYRSYGVSKCENDWVLILDTDERLSPPLKRGLRHIADTENFDVVDIKRYENATFSGPKSSFYTWQRRLFRKGKIEFLGLIHETPKALGRVKKLTSGKEYMLHIDSLRHAQSDLYNKMFLFSTESVLPLISRDIAVWLTAEKRKGGLRFMMRKINTQLDYKRRQDKKVMEIARKINAEGITRYLDLDQEDVIKKLNRKYGGKKDGIDLLIKLLVDKHDGRYLR